jgi:DNA-binding MarR family transcriptional regulator
MDVAINHVSGNCTVPAPPSARLDRIKHPDHIDEFLLYRIHKLARVGMRGVGLMFRREVGISRRDWRILAFVGQHPGLNLTKLSELTGLDTVVASRCVAKLVQRGLLASARQRDNKRVLTLHLTDEGEVSYARARAGGRQYNMELAACLSDDEACQLDELLRKLEVRASELTEREMRRSGGALRDEADE